MNLPASNIQRAFWGQELVTEFVFCSKSFLYFDFAFAVSPRIDTGDSATLVGHFVIGKWKATSSGQIGWAKIPKPCASSLRTSIGVEVLSFFYIPVGIFSFFYFGENETGFVFKRFLTKDSKCLSPSFAELKRSFTILLSTCFPVWCVLLLHQKWNYTWRRYVQRPSGFLHFWDVSVWQMV